MHELSMSWGHISVLAEHMLSAPIVPVLEEGGVGNSKEQ